MGDDFFTDENEAQDPAPPVKGIQTEEAKRIHELGQIVADYAIANTDKDLFAFTLTYADWASIKYHYAQAHSFAEYVASRPGEGLLLVCEIGDDGLFHWHGIGPSTRSRDSLAANWLYRSPATQEATLITYVKLQDERKSQKRAFKIELTRAIQYRCQPCPHLPLSLHERAVAAGIMKEFWDRAMGRSVIECYDLLYRRVDQGQAASPHEERPVRRRKGTGRPADGLCIRQACRQKIPPKRGRSPYCSGTCRDLDRPSRHGRGRKRRKLRQFSDAGLPNVLERLEDGGSP